MSHSSDGCLKLCLTSGPTNSASARRDAPSSIRAKFGTDGTRNACHGSDSPQSAMRVSDESGNQWLVGGWMDS